MQSLPPKLTELWVIEPPALLSGWCARKSPGQERLGPTTGIGVRKRVCNTFIPPPTAFVTSRNVGGVVCLYKQMFGCITQINSPILSRY